MSKPVVPIPDLRLRGSLAWCLSALALVVVVALFGAGAALAGNGRGPTLQTGSLKGFMVRPTSIYYTGDGSGVIGVLRRGGESGPGRGFLHWRGWSRRGAYATGTLWITLGPPATSPFSRFRVTVTATRVRSGHFTRMTLRYRESGRLVTDNRCIADHPGVGEWGVLFHGTCA